MVRPLTPAIKKQLHHFSNDGSNTSLVIGLVVFVPFAWILASQLHLHVRGTVVIYLLLAGILLLSRLLITSPMRKAEAVYQYGQEIPIVVEEFNYNSLPGRRGRIPRHYWEIVVRQPSGLVRIKTGKRVVADAFRQARQSAYVYAKYPNMLVPARVLSPDYYNPSYAQELSDAPTIRM